MQSTELLKYRGSADAWEQLLHDLGARLEDLGVFEEGVDGWNNVVNLLETRQDRLYSKCRDGGKEVGLFFLGGGGFGAGVRPRPRHLDILSPGL